MRLALATALAILLEAPASWGHTFPAQRSVVLQVEPCEVVLLVGYRPGTGEQTETMLTRAATQPKSRGLESLKAMLTKQAMASLTFTIDGVPRVPTSVRAKLGTEPGGARPMIVLLVTYALPAANQVALLSKEPRTTRISWADHASHRVEIDHAPAQGRFYDGVASFLLSLPASGGSACVTYQSSVLDSSAH